MSRHWSMEPPKVYGGKAISNKCLEPFMKDGYGFKRFDCNRELIRGFDAATEKAHLPILVKKVVWKRMI